ncbi:MAG: tRNA pseudouridine(55) synthase TruB [Solirubrobacteraceae bacterium]
MNQKRTADRGAQLEAGPRPGDGVMLYDKPAGITSHDVVARVRRALPRGVKVGHAGTLDPFATGLLLVLVGRATRVQRFLMALRKTYEAVAQFGWVSSTGDPEGELVRTDVVPSGDLQLPIGALRQRPPAFSAVKVGGRRSYALARAGIEVELAEREVELYRFEERWRKRDRRAFTIECSSGTYVRSLIAALGDAYCAELRRTRIGSFDVGDADEARVLGLDDALGFLPAVRLSGEDARRARHGATVQLPAPAGAAGAPGAPGAPGAVRLLDDHGLIALARVVGDPLRARGGGEQTGAALKPIVGFRN